MVWSWPKTASRSYALQRAMVTGDDGFWGWSSSRPGRRRPSATPREGPYRHEELSAVQVVPHGGSPSARSGRSDRASSRDVIDSRPRRRDVQQEGRQPQSPVGRRGDASMLPRAVLQWRRRPEQATPKAELTSACRTWRPATSPCSPRRCDRSRRQLGYGNPVSALEPHSAWRSHLTSEPPARPFSDLRHPRPSPPCQRGIASAFASFRPVPSPPRPSP